MTHEHTKHMFDPARTPGREEWISVGWEGEEPHGRT
jgi:hypothetical protein